MRKTKTYLIFLLFPSLMFPSLAGAESKIIQVSREKFKNKAFSKQIIEEESSENSQKKNNDLVRMIKGFQMVIKTEENEAKRLQLVLSQSSAYLALSRNIRIMTKPDPVQVKNEKMSLDRVLINSKVIINSKAADANMRSRAYYYSGIAYSYLNQNDKMVESFKLSLKQNPNATWAPSLSLAIAENYFDQEQYEQAIKQYKVYFSKYNYEQKSLATYKMAWAYLNLDKLTDAENFFIYLIDKPWSKEFGTDSLKDLAYVTTLHRSEEDIIAFSMQHFSKDPLRRVDFLIYTFKYFYQQSVTKQRPILLAEILNNEKRVNKRLNVLVMNLRAQQRQYASTRTFSEFLKVKNEMVNNKVSITSSDFQENAVELEVEVLALTKSYYDTFVGKTKTPENLPKLTIDKNLEELLEFHNSFFPESKEREKTLSVWFNVCTELKSPECSYKVSKKILADDRVSNLRQKAFAEYILAMDQLSKKDRKYRDEMIGALTEFANKEEKSQDWHNLTKKLTALLNEDQRYKESLPWLEKIHQKQPSSESLYRLTLVQFQMGSYEVVSQTQVPYTDALAAQITDIKHQSLLKMAQDGLQNNNYDKYESYILAYIKDEKNPVKAEQALKDYLIRTLEKNEYEKVFAGLMSLKREKRTLPLFMPITTKLLLKYMQSGKWAEVNKLLSPYDIKEKKETDIFWYAHQLEMNKGLSDNQYEQIMKSPNSIKKMMVGFLSLFYPEVLVSKFKKFPSNDLFIRKAVFLASQVYSQKWDVSFTPQFAKLLGDDVVPVEIRNQELTQTEKSLLGISFPKYDVNPKTLSRRTKEVVDVVVASRQLLLKALKNKLPQIKIRILDTAIKAEMQTSEFLLGSPIPDGLNPDQMEQYQAQLKEVASGFSNQAEEYKKIKKNIEDAMNTPINVINISNIDSMSFPDLPIVSYIKKAVSDNLYSSAGMALEFWRAENETDKETYYGLRAYILVKMQASVFMQDYVLSELKSSNQKRWLDYLKISEGAKL